MTVAILWVFSTIFQQFSASYHMMLETLSCYYSKLITTIVDLDVSHFEECVLVLV